MATETLIATQREVDTYNRMKTDLVTGTKYTGARLGFVHNWQYPNGRWKEKKVAPDRWAFSFACTKRRKISAPKNSGAGEGTKYHWLILADQQAEKLDNDQYKTLMVGTKFKMGHKRPYWRGYSYDYPEQKSYRQSLIEKLEAITDQLKHEEAMEEQAPARSSLKGL